VNLLTRDPLDAIPQYRYDVAPAAPSGDLVADTTVIENSDGQRLLLYGSLEGGELCDRLLKWFPRLRGWQDSKQAERRTGTGRLSGLKNSHCVFGATPPVPLRSRWGASISQMNLRYPGAAVALESLAVACADQFAEQMPDEWAHHSSEVRGNIDAGWLMAGGRAPWTSCIVNHSSAMAYHRDASNIKGSMSAMVVLRDTVVGGGRLHIPALDVILACGHGSLSIFDGCKTLHGVTPMTGLERGHRFSIVFYAKREFGEALPPGQEVRRAQQRTTASAERQVERQEAP
jgi:hypothetical protein